MKIIKKTWKNFLESVKRSREVMKITRSYQTQFKCPKCKSYLSQIVYSKSVDPQYFCSKCGYEGLGKI